MEGMLVSTSHMHAIPGSPAPRTPMTQGEPHAAFVGVKQALGGEAAGHVAPPIHKTSSGYLLTGAPGSGRLKNQVGWQAWAWIHVSPQALSSQYLVVLTLLFQETSGDWRRNNFPNSPEEKGTHCPHACL